MRKVLLFTAMLFSTLIAVGQSIRMSCSEIELILRVGANGRLYQVYLGDKLSDDSDTSQLTQLYEAYITNGLEDYLTPAIRLTNGDGNGSLLLKYVTHTTQKSADNGMQTIITLKDDQYPTEVRLIYEYYPEENIIKSRSEISHQQKKDITLYNYASSMLHFKRSHYYLTQFSGEWAREVNPNEQELFFGKKILDSQLGTRANLLCSPFFILSLDQKSQENSGTVVLGTLGWTGNFSFNFEVDQLGGLRVISGINPFNSEYTLKRGEVFRTPEFIFTLSNQGTGKASRNFHSWARKYQLKDGRGTRMTLLNNWEATSFDFNEDKLVNLFDQAADIGVDLFLLDDGWFGNKYPRNSDQTGLGDWEVTKDKLPGGIAKLVEQATRRGVKFGIWIEPEMVNPKSELYEKHKDWIIRLPNREEYYHRNQLVLDLANPEVQKYVFGVIDKLMIENPDISYMKWDCNSTISNNYSPYLKDKQSHLFIDYVKGLYCVLEMVKAKYPHLPMMLCSGGGGRTDYEALKYFVEFWASDNTDAIERLYIQWGYSQFFPVKSIAAHVTSWGKQPLKFRVDAASMCRLGFDIRLAEMSEGEREFCRQAIKNYDSYKTTILDGDLYRLVSPFEGNHTSLMYVNEAKTEAVLFAFDMNCRFSENVFPVRLNGLNPDKNYEFTEINRLSGAKVHKLNGQLFSGDYLMKAGVDLLSSKSLSSRIFVLKAR